MKDYKGVYKMQQKIKWFTKVIEFFNSTFLSWTVPLLVVVVFGDEIYKKWTRPNIGEIKQEINIRISQVQDFSDRCNNMNINKDKWKDYDLVQKNYKNIYTYLFNNNLHCIDYFDSLENNSSNRMESLSELIVKLNKFDNNIVALDNYTKIKNIKNYLDRREKPDPGSYDTLHNLLISLQIVE